MLRKKLLEKLAMSLNFSILRKIIYRYCFVESWIQKVLYKFLWVLTGIQSAVHTLIIPCKYFIVLVSHFKLNEYLIVVD